jgi:cytochrome c-type biogenesis protein CcmH/NrfF
MKWVIAGGFALLIGCAPVSVEDAQASRDVQKIVRTTNSPFCPGKTLDSCPSPRAAEWRRDIHEWVEEGASERDIRARLQARAPGFELGVPAVASGWVIPLVAVLLSTIWLLIVARTLRVPAPPRRSRPPSDHAGLDARLDEELARMD